MKFSEQWLRDWVNPEITREQLVEQITMAGLEVDEVAAVAGDFKGVLVGSVVECGQHPNADKLRVTKVDVGAEELLDIVCGAPNCRQGLKVAVAVVGAVLPGDFKIKKAKLRGEPSFGMLCSASELQLSEEHDGIIELPEDAPIGADIRDYLQLDDATIEVDLTPNRADCLGIKGLAREVGVLNSTDVTEPQIDEVAPSIEETRSIELVAPEACPRYLGRVIRNVNVAAKSPLWMVEKLRRCGVRSIDPVVDVTNYVLLELGHPMHAFDLDKLNGGIKVRFPKAGEKLTLLDGNEVELQADTLVIADQEKPVAMAGIFGGLDSGVTEQSQHIFLESAFFAPLAIAGKARQYGLHTDASHRYERGVDPELQHRAMQRATNLLLDIVGGEAGPVVEAVAPEHIPQSKNVLLRNSRLTRLLGIDIAAEQVTEMLQRLGFGVEAQEQQWQVSVPSYRFDISIEEDLIEEVARVYGYNNIPNVAPTAELRMAPAKEVTLSLNRAKQMLLARDYNEAITYSFVDPKHQELLFPELSGLTLPHPISADMSVMRVSLWPGLLQAAAFNQKRQQSRVRLFESGLRFVPDANEATGVRQEAVLSGVITGEQTPAQWFNETQKVDFFDVKGDVQALLQQVLPGVAFRFERTSSSALHPGQSAAIYRGEQQVGLIGALHPQFEKTLGLSGKTLMFELHLDALGDSILPDSQPIAKHAASKRDIAVVVKEHIEAEEVLTSIKNFGANQLLGLNLFDVYRGTGIAEGHKSLAISLILQDAEKTLEESEIQTVVDAVVHGLEDEFGAALRD